MSFHDMNVNYVISYYRTWQLGALHSRLPCYACLHTQGQIPGWGSTQVHTHFVDARSAFIEEEVVSTLLRT